MNSQYLNHVLRRDELLDIAAALDIAIDSRIRAAQDDAEANRQVVAWQALLATLMANGYSPKGAPA